jgi:hypothetical protein
LKQGEGSEIQPSLSLLKDKVTGTRTIRMFSVQEINRLNTVSRDNIGNGIVMLIGHANVNIRDTKLLGSGFGFAG